MKTKTTLLILTAALLISLFAANVKAQNEWFPEGATWHYGCTSFAMDGYQKLYYHKDTIIKGYGFKTIASLSVMYDHIDNSTYFYLNEDAYFLREDSNIIYWYHQNLDTIYTLYNFNSSVGDTWKIPPDPMATPSDTSYHGSYAIAQVDSIDYVVINGDSLKRYFLKYNGSYHCYSPGTASYCIVSPIVEKIGARWLFPWGTYIHGAYNCSGPRCYEDINFPLHNFYPSTPCDLTVEMKDTYESSALQIFPNPTQNYIVIDGLKSDNTLLEIYDIHGRLILQQNLTQQTNRVCLKDFSKGIMFLRLSDGNDFIIEKIIKL